MLEWTNINLLMKSEKLIDEDMLNAFFGLEIATSIVKMNCLRDYWSTKLFLGHQDFSKVMGRDRFLSIRSGLRIHPFTKYAVHSDKDPLWHSRLLMEHFNDNCVDIATPCGVSSYDEITVRFKARCLSKSFIKNKPVPYGIRLYACVGWKDKYLYSIFDNGKGNTIEIIEE